MALRVVQKDHAASYDDPIKLVRGDELSLTGREHIWDRHRWLWAISRCGREGWIPDNLVAETDRRPTAARDYSAIELTCSVGEAVNALHETHGWAWCRNRAGGEGWLPVANLAAF